MNIQPCSQNQQQSFGITPIYGGNNPAKSKAKLKQFLQALTPKDRATVLRRFEKSPARVSITYARDNNEFSKSYGLTLKLADATDDKDPWAYIFGRKFSKNEISEFKENFLFKLPVPRRPKKSDAEVTKKLMEHLDMEG